MCIDIHYGNLAYFTQSLRNKKYRLQIYIIMHTKDFLFNFFHDTFLQVPCIHVVIHFPYAHAVV